MPNKKPDADKPESSRQARGRPLSMEKRAAMLRAATVEFGTAGYASVSMDAIAARAQVSKRTLYNHFPSKELLFGALIEQLASRIGQTEKVKYRPEESLRTQLYDYALVSASHVRDAETLQLFRAILGEHLRSVERVEPALRRYWRTEYGFVAWIEAAVADGRLRVESPERAAHIFQSMIKGVGVWPVVFERKGETRKEVLQALQEAVDVFLSYYAT